MFSLVMASACNDDDNDDETQVNNNVQILGFNTWDDIASFDLNPTFFGGNWSINRDPQYISEGSGSWKIYVEATMANQPDFKMVANPNKVKTDISDVTEFTLWAHSNAEEPFEIVITAYSGSEVVCAPTATVNKGANNLTFKLRREALVQRGKIITDYSISFSGIKGGTTLYLDDFSAKTTTEPVVFKPEIQEVITAIENFSSVPTRQQVEAALAKYRVLSSEDKICVTNYNDLKSAALEYQLSDLAAAKVESPETWLFLGESFGEIQVSGATKGAVSSYYYSEEQHHGDDSGALKVEFAVTSTNWVTLSTDAVTKPEGEYLEFYVYNDSDQIKGMCVGWNAPKSPYNGKTFYYTLASRHWTRILCKSSDLYDAGGASGGIQIVGLKDLVSFAGQPPEGAMYFSSFVTIDEDALKGARTGEDANTLYFFDRKEGTAHLTPAVDVFIPYQSVMEFEYSTEVKFGDEEGSLAVTSHEVEYPEGAAKESDPTIKWNMMDYDFNEGDYVVFYVYNDSDVDVVDISLNTPHRQRCYNGQWTMVLWSAADVMANDWSWLIGRDANGKYIRFTGTIYFSKAKVYSAEQVKDLTEVADNFQYTVGNTTFIGKAENVNGTYGSDDPAFNTDASFSNPFYVNGTLRWNVLPNKTPTIDDFRPKMGFTFKQAKAVTANTYMEVTFGNEVNIAGDLYIEAFNSDGTAFTDSSDSTVIKGALVDGTTNTYRFNVGSLSTCAAATNFASFRLCADWITHPVTTQFVVTDITVG